MQVAIGMSFPASLRHGSNRRFNLAVLFLTPNFPNCMPPTIERNPVTVAKLVSNVQSPSVAPATAAVDNSSLRGTRAAVIVFSYYPSDPRVMRAARGDVQRRDGRRFIVHQKLRSRTIPRADRRVDVFRVDRKKRRAGKLSYASQYLTFLVLSFFWLSRRQLARHYDLVHVHNMPDFLVFSAGLAKLLGSRVVLDLHDPTPEVFITVYGLKPNNWLVRLLRIVEGLSISFADLVLTPNIAFRNLFVSRNCPPGKIAIVMNSPLEKVFPLKEPANKSASDWLAGSEFVVMFHGTVLQRHGLHSAIEAVARLREHIPGLRFHIYGEHTAYLREQVRPSRSQAGIGGPDSVFR